MTAAVSAHIGFSYDGDIEHNSILFNQSTNPTIPTNGGGLLDHGRPRRRSDLRRRPPTRIACLRRLGLRRATASGPGLVINANLIMGNSAESGSGGGMRFQHVNGTEVINFPNGAPCELAATVWNSRSVTNNIIVNNVAGWDGARRLAAGCVEREHRQQHDRVQRHHGLLGRAVQHARRPAGQHAGTDLHTRTAARASAPQPAGLVSMQNSAVFTANLPATITCPAGHVHGGRPAMELAGSTRARCCTTTCSGRTVVLHRSGRARDGTLNQQNVVTLLPTLNQRRPGQCLSTYPSAGTTGTSACAATRVRPTTPPASRCRCRTRTRPPLYRGGLRQQRVQSGRHQSVLQWLAIPPEYALACPAGTGCRHGLLGASGHLGCDRAQPALQPDAGGDRGRGQQLGQPGLGSAVADESDSCGSRRELRRRCSAR